MRILRPEEITEFPPLKELSSQELAEAYAVAKAAFTAEDLQRYTETDEGVPVDEVLEELEQAQSKAEQGTA